MSPRKHKLDNSLLEGEIDLLRNAIRRVAEVADQAEDLDQLFRAVRTLSSAAARLAILLKAQAELGHGQGDLAETLASALEEAMHELEQKP